MFLTPYFQRNGDEIRIPAAQASRFAKEIANDFNPIHDSDNMRFCVPGDLLFALVLTRQGISPRMHFNFSGMLKDAVVRLPTTPTPAFALKDDSGKTYLELTRDGEAVNKAPLIENLVRKYVAFSGQNFPHILVPLMEQHQVMINAARPLVIYESMSFDLQRLDVIDLDLELVDSTLTIDGKRGNAELHFRFFSDGQTIGAGVKKLVLSGLRDYQADAMQDLVNRFNSRKAAYQASCASASPQRGVS
jgi:hypothetical protein